MHYLLKEKEATSEITVFMNATRQLICGATSDDQRVVFVELELKF